MGRIDAGQLLLGTLLVSGLGAGDAMAQAPTTVAAADYERAAKMLGDRTAPLVGCISTPSPVNAWRRASRCAW